MWLNYRSWKSWYNGLCLRSYIRILDAKAQNHRFQLVLSRLELLAWRSLSTFERWSQRRDYVLNRVIYVRTSRWRATYFINFLQAGDQGLKKARNGRLRGIWHAATKSFAATEKGLVIWHYYRSRNGINDQDDPFNLYNLRMKCFEVLEGQYWVVSWCWIFYIQRKTCGR